MNQKYLAGYCYNGSRIIFEACPENIAAYLIETKRDAFSGIYTLDGKCFLTARYGFVDVCPDQDYLREKLLPVLAPIQMGRMPVPRLSQVSPTQTDQYECPIPDWNYLRWQGYSDEQYNEMQKERSPDRFVNYSTPSGIRKIQFRAAVYQEGHNLVIDLFELQKESVVFIQTLSANVQGRRDKNCTYIGVHRSDAALRMFMEEQGIAQKTGNMIPDTAEPLLIEYRFNAEVLTKMDPEGYQQYLNYYEKDRNNRNRKER